MDDEILIVENFLGKDAVEKMKKIQTDALFYDQELKNLFEEICSEIEEGNIDDKELVNILKVLPYDYSALILGSLSTNNALTIFRSSIYDEFIQDVNNVDKNGVTAFEKRYINISLKDNENFKRKRILVREEIESLIGRVVKKSNIEDKSYKNTHETYSGDNKYLISLIKAHKVLSEENHSRARKQIKDKNIKQMLLSVVQRIKQNGKNNLY